MGGPGEQVVHRLAADPCLLGDFPQGEVLLAVHAHHVPLLGGEQPAVKGAEPIQLDFLFQLSLIHIFSAYGDRSFDLVISFDAPVSSTYPNQEKVLGELVRLARKRVMVSVSSRLGYLPYLANPVQKNQFILDEDSDDAWVRWCVANRQRMIDGFTFDKAAAEKLLADGLMGGEAEIAEYERGGAPWCITYTFLPDELEGILRRLGDVYKRQLLMSYRDNAPAVLACGEWLIPLAKQLGKKLILAVETGKIYEDINITFHHLGTARMYRELERLHALVCADAAAGEIGYAIHHYDSWRRLPAKGHPRLQDYPYENPNYRVLEENA